ncbi:hypothetical protein [Parasedimentitalea maritima]|uniref:Uncharacterized protein n=1 Tax=Parasedimentitalea maritima TaxID=2578117 RepID=A0A6A4RFA6_9RHOB|nr:hypothetical protein [Zongyanglinia marina]KAE9627591.1 hypothetical protein GP644_18585 [Zongyanglinia marina]
MNEREAKCVDAVLRFLEAKMKGVRQDPIFPEQELATPRDRRVELCAKIDGVNFAIEHTLIEPFEGWLKQGRLVSNIENMVRGNLKEHMFSVGIDIIFPTDIVERLSKSKKVKEFVSALSYKLKELSSEIQCWPDNYRVRSIGSIKGVELSACRNSFEEISGADIFPCFFHTAPEFRNISQRDRVMRALDKKVPKLSRWHSSHTTVLILENQDISLTGWHTVHPIIEKCWLSQDTLPVDYLFFLGAAHSTWRLYPFVEEGRWSTFKPNGLVRVDTFGEDELADHIG